MSAGAAAIAQAEGFGQPGAVPTIANNPGDLELGNIGYGVTKAAAGQQITNFPTLQAGQAALENQINLITTGQSTAGYNPSMSIAQVGQLYSGGSSNWANNVATALGVTPGANFAAAVGGAGGSATPTGPATSSNLSTDSTDDSTLMGTTTQDLTPYYIAAAIAALAALTYAVA